jgi:hypothetical protein
MKSEPGPPGAVSPSRHFDRIGVDLLAAFSPPERICGTPAAAAAPSLPLSVLD